MPPLRIGLIGCGRLAERGYVPALARAEGVELAAVADPVTARCAQAAPGVPSYSSAAELIAAGAAEALVLATPAGEHLADARAAAAAGLPTLVEKPPAATLAEARELALLEPEPRFAFNRRFVPELEHQRSALPTHGPVELALEMSTRAAGWGAYAARDDVLLNLGPHLVDLARWLSGAEIARVRANVTASSASLELELGEGRGRARVHCSEGPYRERVRVTAAGRRVGGYSAGGALDAVRLLLARGRAQHPLVPSLVRQLEAFAGAARGASPPHLAGARDAVAVMATLEAARASSAQGGEWVSAEPG